MATTIESAEDPQSVFEIDLTKLQPCGEDLYWHGCYNTFRDWRKYVTPESFAHPAKMAPGLCDTIFKHLKKLELLKEDSVVCDFMSGIGSTNIMAALHGYESISVELEPHFIEMQTGYDCDGKTAVKTVSTKAICGETKEHPPHTVSIPKYNIEKDEYDYVNIECDGIPQVKDVYKCGKNEPHDPHHISGNREVLQKRTGKSNGWEVIQGDARELSSLLKKGCVGVVSPPYFQQGNRPDPDDKTINIKGRVYARNLYTENNPSNIGNLKDKPLVGVVSPPYGLGIGTGHGGDIERPILTDRKVFQDYNKDNPSNIGNLKDKPLVGVISPPYTNPRPGDKPLERDIRRGYAPMQGFRSVYPEGKGQIGNLPDKELVGIVSPPYTDIGHIAGDNADSELNPDRLKMQKRYTETMRSEGNIQKLPDRGLVGITSPPYAEIGIGDYKNKREAFVKWITEELKTKGYIEWQGKKYTEKEWREMNYGRLDGRVMVGSPKMGTEGYNPNSKDNIGNLPDKELVGIVSPPYADSDTNAGKSREDLGRNKYLDGKHRFYSGSTRNIGNQKGETYLEAMLQVYQEAYKAGISPLVTVTKNPTRNGELRRLDLDTANLLMQAGYEIIDYHRAILFEERHQLTLGGDTKTTPKGRLSFFKRLSYQKGNAVAKWEDIIIATRQA